MGSAGPMLRHSPSAARAGELHRGPVDPQAQADRALRRQHDGQGRFAGHAAVVRHQAQHARVQRLVVRDVQVGVVARVVVRRQPGHLLEVLRREVEQRFGLAVEGLLAPRHQALVEDDISDSRPTRRRWPGRASSDSHSPAGARSVAQCGESVGASKSSSSACGGRARRAGRGPRLAARDAVAMRQRGQPSASQASFCSAVSRPSGQCSASSA